MKKLKLIRTSTIPLSLNVLMKGQLSYLNQSFEVVAVSGAGKDLDDVQDREQVRVEAVQMERQISFFKDLVSLWKLYCLFRKEKPQIIHSITPKAGLLTMLAGKLAGVPIRMHTFTGLIFPTTEGLTRNVLIWMDRLLVYCATNVYPEGKGVKRDLLKYGIVNKRIKVLGNGNVNGIDLIHYAPDTFSQVEVETLKEKYGIRKNDLVFCFVGRLVSDKGINELVAAFVDLRLQFQEAKLLLVGSFESDLDPLLPETLNQIETNPAILAVGFKQDIRPFLMISDVFVLPSYREGFPNVVLQAGALGLPCIVTDINGSKEIIFQNINGIIVPPRDAIELRNAMQIMGDQSDLRFKMSDKARKLIESRYNQTFVWDCLLKEYYFVLKQNNLLDNKSSRST